MKCKGRRTNGQRCGGFVYVCKTCGARGCGIPGCESRGQKNGLCFGCKGALLVLTK